MPPQACAPARAGRLPVSSWFQPPELPHQPLPLRKRSTDAQEPSLCGRRGRGAPGLGLLRPRGPWTLPPVPLPLRGPPRAWPGRISLAQAHVRLQEKGAWVNRLQFISERQNRLGGQNFNPLSTSFPPAMKLRVWKGAQDSLETLPLLAFCLLSCTWCSL